MNVTDEIKDRLDVVSVISDHVSLAQAGRNFKGLCPFHQEKTPSFFVFPDRQSWRCFGCGSGGDIISFVMKREGLDFGTALKSLADRAGVSLPEKKRKGPEDGGSARLYAINEAAAQYYQELLLGSPAADQARAYVARRSLNPETVRQFRLGYSLDEWDGLKRHLREKGYREGELVAAGLASEKDSRIFDRFRGRLMFPICDAKGRVLGFGARALDDSTPKYLNSAESPIFSKSSVLYALDQASEAIREERKVVIVEGYMDAVTAHQAGFRNVIASMGTALTEKQIGLLRGLASRVCLSLDADAAGNAATLRGIEICRQALERGPRSAPNWLAGSTELKAEISIIPIPEGKDPDDVIRQDPDEWRRLVDNALPLMDYLLGIAQQRFDTSRPEGRSQIIDQLLPLIAEIRDGLEREVYLGKLSRLTGVGERTLAARAAQVHVARKDRRTLRQPDVTTRPPKPGDPLEEHCLSLILADPSLAGHAGGLSEDHFERSENRELFLAWQACRDPDDMEQNLDAALHEHCRRLRTRERPPADRAQREQELSQCVRRLEERRLRAALQAEDNVEENSIRLRELWRRTTS